MPDYIGLYYPNIAFPGEAWVKQAILYWDSLARIVPPGYQLHDSPTVQRLKALDPPLIWDLEPSFQEIFAVGQLFSRFVQRYGEQLIQKYRVLTSDSDLEYVYSDAKMTDELSESLLDLGLAVQKRRERSSGHQKIGMHPKLAFVYMEALAAQMASGRYQPVTDTICDHVTMGKYTMGRLAQALLKPDDRHSQLIGDRPTEEEIERLMASIALKIVLPRDANQIPVETIIQLREQETGLKAFHHYIHDFVRELETIEDVDMLRDIIVHLSVAYRDRMKPELDKLERQLNSLARETVFGVLDVRVALPRLLAGLHLPIAPEVAAAGAIAYSISPVFQSRREEALARVNASPVAYLFYVRRELAPATLVSRIRQQTRRMLIGV